LKLIDLAFTVCDCVVMRLPKNFDLSGLDSMGLEYELEQNLFNGQLLHYCAYFKSSNQD